MTDDLLQWLDQHRTLELLYYTPVYCDDDDQDAEWRVFKRSGSINDRQWDIVGRGNTPAGALLVAKDYLQGQ